MSDNRLPGVTPKRSGKESPKNSPTKKQTGSFPDVHGSSDRSMDVEPFNVANYEPSERDKKYIAQMQRVKKTRLAMANIHQLEQDAERQYREAKAAKKLKDDEEYRLKMLAMADEDKRRAFEAVKEQVVSRRNESKAQKQQREKEEAAEAERRRKERVKADEEMRLFKEQQKLQDEEKVRKMKEEAIAEQLRSEKKYALLEEQRRRELEADRKADEQAMKEAREEQEAADRRKVEQQMAAKEAAKKTR